MNTEKTRAELGSKGLLACTEPMLQAAMDKAVENGLFPVADCCEAVANNWKRMRECINASLQANVQPSATAR